jgi:hypothetical protein
MAFNIAFASISPAEAAQGAVIAAAKRASAVNFTAILTVPLASWVSMIVIMPSLSGRLGQPFRMAHLSRDDLASDPVRRSKTLAFRRVPGKLSLTESILPTSVEVKITRCRAPIERRHQRIDLGRPARLLGNDDGIALWLDAISPTTES